MYVTAVGGREERLREQMAQHAANAAQGAGAIDLIYHSHVLTLCDRLCGLPCRLC